MKRPAQPAFAPDLSTRVTRKIELHDLPPGEQGAFRDPFGTGIRNLLAYALDFSPASPEWSRLPQLALRDEIDENHLDFDFPAPRTDLSYLVERSADLVSWSLIDVELLPLGNDFFRTSIPVAEGKSLFMRLRVEPH